MANKFPVGQLVVCTRVNDERFGMLVGAVGEITAIAPAFVAALMGEDYAVFFPAMKEARCPGCGKTHGGEYGMSHNELKALNDPDEGKTIETSEELDVPEFGFAH